MTAYNRGRAFEYRCRDALRESGCFVVFRSAGSKTLADLVALRRGETWLVQCKLDGHISKAEREALQLMTNELGCVGVVAYREPKQKRIVFEEVNKLWTQMY